MNFIYCIPTFSQEILVSYDDTPEQFKNFLTVAGVAHKKYMKLPDTGAGLTVLLDSGQVLIILTPQSKYSLMCTITHEVFHAVTLFLDFRGVKFKMDTSDEVYAYLMGEISSIIFEKLGL